MQNDLISRSVLIKEFEDAFAEGLIESFDDVIGTVEEQPTAYDVEKVVAELEELPSTEVNMYGVPQPYINKHSVLRVVRNGGKE